MAEAEETRPAALAWDEELRARGYRVTPQRQLVLEAIAMLDHATPEEIAERVQQTARGVNISTIYRTLELLDKLGLVTHTHLRHGAPTYHLASDANHVHLVCQDCERVTEISPDAIRALVVALDEAQGFETDVTHLTVFGRCAQCRGQESKSRSLCVSRSRGFRAAQWGFLAAGAPGGPVSAARPPRSGGRCLICGLCPPAVRCHHEVVEYLRLRETQILHNSAETSKQGRNVTVCRQKALRAGG